MTEPKKPDAPAATGPAKKHARDGKSNATIYDIAKVAGVNPSTVSRALSKPGRVSAKTQKLIEDAAAELNYQVNPFARALPTGRTNTYGLIVADITNPTFFDIIRGARPRRRCGTTRLCWPSPQSQPSPSSRRPAG